MMRMSKDVIETHPASCGNGHDWNRPRSHYPGWDSGVLTGSVGHRIWTCATCGDIRHRATQDPVFAGMGDQGG